MARVPNSSEQTLDLLTTLLDSGQEWRYGYDLSKETNLRSGTLYPMLMRLERQGWLETHWSEPAIVGRPARHMYRLSADGLVQASAALLRAKQAPKRTAQLRGRQAPA